MRDVIIQYNARGLCALPAILAEKRPACGTWKQFREKPPRGASLNVLCNMRHDAVCVLCGKASGNLEALDFDGGGELFEPWRLRVQNSELTDQLLIEVTPSGGRHVVYRCEEPIEGNQKLATRAGETLIETRGEGGLILCAPSPGYEVVQGSFENIPTITAAHRTRMLRAARGLDEASQKTAHANLTGVDSTFNLEGSRPGDDYNRRGDVREVLQQFGWIPLGTSGENEHWRRPGKESGNSATLKDRVFYVFSSNAAPFEPNRAYSPFAVYTLLEHQGDFESAGAALSAAGYGLDWTQSDPDVDLSGIMAGVPGGPQNTIEVKGFLEPHYLQLTDPGLLPIELLRIPGFVGELSDYTLATAPYPNQVMAFCGALAVLSYLTARKYRDPGDNRTNLYLLGLAQSASGKEWPRKVNTRLLHEVGAAEGLGDRFASGEGIQDALVITPALLFQTDEIDTLLQAMKMTHDGRHEMMLGILLTLYSASSSLYPVRRKAGQESMLMIDQPSVTIFGTAIPSHYYNAMSERTLTNGLFARMLIFEAGPRPEGQEPSIEPLPERCIETARWLHEFSPSQGDLEEYHPDPAIVPYDDEARALVAESRRRGEVEYSKAEAEADEVGTTVWGRVTEQVRKLALLYAISENAREPIITAPAVQWADAVVMHQTHRALWMAAQHVADNQAHAECLRALRKLRDAGGKISHSRLLRMMKIDARALGLIVATLEQRGDIESVIEQTSGRPTKLYRLVNHE